jgi:hypothetical protein
MKFKKLVLAGIIGVAMAVPAAGAEDSRQLVSLPAPMQSHMLANMRDHLLALSEILDHISAEKFAAAAEIAEKRIGMSSLGLHGASHMAPYMPKPMQEIGSSMHRAASRFATLAMDADVKRSYESMREVNKALHDVTSTCVACHAGYRIR